MKHALAVVSLLVTLAGCLGAGQTSLPDETFSNTVWQEVCVGGDPETVYLRFLPDGTFAYSTTDLNPGDFRHDGDDRWGIVGRTLVVSWDGDAQTTQYNRGEEPGVFVGDGTRACEPQARLEHVE